MEYDGCLYVVHKTDKKLRVTQLPDDLSRGVTLFEVKRPSGTFIRTSSFVGTQMNLEHLEAIPKLSVSRAYIAVTDGCSKELLLYDRSSQTVTALNESQLEPYNDVHFFSDTSLLATSWESRNIVFWDVKEQAVLWESRNLVLLDLEELRIIWSCDKLHGAKFVTRDPSSGLIYVTGDRRVHIISPTGTFIIMIWHDRTFTADQ